MRNFFQILLTTIACALCGTAPAQTLTLSIPDTTVAPGEMVNLSIRSEGFDEIVSMQFSISWDTTVIVYQSSEKGAVENVAIGDIQSGSGNLRLSWFDVEGTGQSFPDSTVVTNLQFLARGSEGSSTPVDFTDTPLAIQVYRAGSKPGEYTAVEFNPVHGRVTIATPLENISVAEKVTDISCAGAADGEIELNIIYDDEYTVRWAGPDFSSNKTFISNLGPGEYAFSVEGTNGTTLYKSAIQLTEPEELIISNVDIQAADCVMGTGSASVTLEGGVGPYMYDLGNGPGDASLLEDLAPADYTLMVSDANGCTTGSEFSISGPDLPVVDLGPSREICPGETTTLTAGIFAGYSWSTGANSQGITLSEPGVYGVTVTNEQGCQTSDQIEIQLSEDLPEVDLGPSREICPGETTTLTVGTFAGYSWSTGANSQVIALSEPGIYGVTVTNEQGCRASDEIEIKPAEDLPEVDLGPAVKICLGESVTLSGGTFSSYSWSTGANSERIEVSEPGTYRLTVTNAAGCKDSESIEVQSGGAPPNLDLGPTVQICPGEVATLAAGAFGTYAWSTGANSESIQVSAPGTYALTVSNVEGCQASSEVEVQLFSDLPAVELGPAVRICPGESTTLSAGVFDGYSWSTGADSSSIQVSESGTYTLTVTNSKGCQASDEVDVEVEEEVQLLIENDFLDLCPGDSVELLISGATNYTWIDTSGSLSALDIANPVARPDTTVGYTVIGSSACGSDVVDLEIYVYEVAAMAGPDTCISPGTEAQLMAFGGVSYFWEDSRYPVSDPASPLPMASPEDSTTYVVAITDEQGCVTRDSMIVAVASNPETDLRAVNMITPNEDGKNDVLYFPNIGKFGQNSLKIFNRWGNIVYQKVNYQSDEERFDGTFNDQPLPPGTYYYMLSFRTGEIKQKLTILR